MNFPSKSFPNDGYRAAMLQEDRLWLLPFYMIVAPSCYYENVTEWCALQ